MYHSTTNPELEGSTPAFAQLKEKIAENKRGFGSFRE
jgi:hypothetical protein